jgi:hypothetical protein
MAVGVSGRAEQPVERTVEHPGKPGPERAAEHPGEPRPERAAELAPAFAALKWTSLFHSCVYTSLLLCAFALGKPQPETLVLGWAHGLLWIGMSLTCIAAARMRIVSLKLAVAVAVLGGIGPFFGSIEFLRAQRSDHTQAARARTLE